MCGVLIRACHARRDRRILASRGRHAQGGACASPCRRQHRNQQRLFSFCAYGTRCCQQYDQRRRCSGVTHRQQRRQRACRQCHGRLDRRRRLGIAATTVASQVQVLAHAPRTRCRRRASLPRRRLPMRDVCRCVCVCCVQPRRRRPRDGVSERRRAASGASGIWRRVPPVARASCARRRCTAGAARRRVDWWHAARAACRGRRQ